jgi:hypothetical protein
MGLLVLSAVICGIAVNYIDDRWPHAARISWTVFVVFVIIAVSQLNRLAQCGRKLSHALWFVFDILEQKRLRISFVIGLHDSLDICTLKSRAQNFSLSHAVLRHAVENRALAPVDFLLLFFPQMALKAPPFAQAILPKINAPKNGGDSGEKRRDVRCYL